jgi:hypothetical protein
MCSNFDSSDDENDGSIAVSIEGSSMESSDGGSMMGSSEPTKRNKEDVGALTDMFQDMSVKAPITLDQTDDWYHWDDVVVVALFPHRVNNKVWALGINKSDSMLAYREFEHTMFPGRSVNPIGPVRVFEKSSRWELSVDDGSELEFLTDYHYNIETQTLLGVDIGGHYQLWEFETGSTLIEGDFKYQKDDTTYNVVMNAVCHTADYIIGCTSLDEHGQMSSMFLIHLLTGVQSIIDTNITGIRAMCNDYECNQQIWVGSDNGPMMMDTRVPIEVMTPVSATQWVVAVTGISNLGDLLDASVYLGRIHSWITDFESRDVASDNAIVEHHRMKKDRTILEKGMRAHHIYSDGSDNITVVCDEYVIITNPEKKKLVPFEIKDLLCITTIEGGIIGVSADSTVTMFQSPWATKIRDQEDWARKPIRRCEAEEVCMTKINDGGADTNHMVARVNNRTVFVHAFDGYIFCFKGVYEIA